MTKRIIGIDLAVSAKHKAIVLDPASNEFIGKQISFRARPADMDRLLARARMKATEAVDLIANLEATGMAWYPVAIYLQRHGVTVYRVNGKRTKDFRRALWKHTGSDRIDSRVLTHLYQVAPDRLEYCPLPDGDLLALQRDCRRYARWREQDIAEQNRMKAMDHWAWDGLHKLVPASAQPWMRQHWYNPWRVQEAGEEHLLQSWQTESGEAEAKGMSMTKAGPNLVEATLFLNADVARQWDVQLAAIYHKQMVTFGKHHLQAVCACASHLASRIYAVLKQQRPYQLRDLMGTPISDDLSRELCLNLRVPDEVRKRNNKRFRRSKSEQRSS